MPHTEASMAGKISEGFRCSMHISLLGNRFLHAGKMWHVKRDSSKEQTKQTLPAWVLSSVTNEGNCHITSRWEEREE